MPCVVFKKKGWPEAFTLKDNSSPSLTLNIGSLPDWVVLLSATDTM